MLFSFYFFMNLIDFSKSSNYFCSFLVISLFYLYNYQTLSFHYYTMELPYVNLDCRIINFSKLIQNLLLQYFYQINFDLGFESFENLIFLNILNVHFSQSELSDFEININNHYFHMKKMLILEFIYLQFYHHHF